MLASARATMQYQGEDNVQRVHEERGPLRPMPNGHVEWKVHRLFPRLLGIERQCVVNVGDMGEQGEVGGFVLSLEQ
jgi:hypothetical protein